MEEVIEVFKPRIMHIGHDEAYTFRICPQCRKRTAHDILAGDINKIHSFLTSRGVRPLMWGDKLMNITTPEGRRY
ncbi:MAG: family 20 glycosylhydrolase, partial [Gemmatimonadales bacterium]|nr:family 20 glycosylhydrolase [Gemmatimonadales bacterium]